VKAVVATAALSLSIAWALAAATDSAQGDAVRGRAAYDARCGGCHSVEADRVGPRHAGIFGRRAGSVEGFDYSPALKASRIVWNRETLERWIADPESLVPGQRMNYAVGDAALRADLVAYLALLTAAQR
jgi:cytochrome c